MTSPRPLGMVHDEDVAPVGGQMTGLEALREDMQVETDENMLTLPVPGRDRYSVRYGTVVSYEELAAWRKRAADKSMPGGIDEMRLGCIVLANRCRAIVRDGEDMTAGGEPATFTSAALHEVLGVDRPVDAVRKFYGRDPSVTKTASAVLAAAGWNDDEVDADPTTR